MTSVSTTAHRPACKATKKQKKKEHGGQLLLLFSFLSLTPPIVRIGKGAICHRAEAGRQLPRQSSAGLRGNSPLGEWRVGLTWEKGGLRKERDNRHGEKARCTKYTTEVGNNDDGDDDDDDAPCRRTNGPTRGAGKL
ncbi:hypothetical protein L209DRAFT_461668 [Thermothelomyces heterothallicus CBS 203.75]